VTIAGCTVIDCHHHIGSLEAQGFTFADVDAGKAVGDMPDRARSGLPRRAWASSFAQYGRATVEQLGSERCEEPARGVVA